MRQESGVGPKARGISHRLQEWADRLQALGQRALARVPPWVRRHFARTFSSLFLAVMGWVLYNQLKDTDWPAVFSSLPASPWFYLFFVMRSLILPVTEVLCYSAVWARNLFPYFGAFLMKNVLNVSVAGASGDVYFLLWAVRTLRISYRRAFSAVKDVTLLSAGAANTVAVIFLGGYLLSGDLTLADKVPPEALQLIIGVTLAAAALSLLVIVFRGKVLSVSKSVMWRILRYHGVRSAGSIVLLGLQWTAGLPGSVFTAWISLLVVDLLVSRTPFVPGRSLLFLSLALELADTIDAPEAQVTALFMTDAALWQLTMVPSLIAGTAWRSKPQPLPLDPDAESSKERVASADTG